MDHDRYVKIDCDLVDIQKRKFQYIDKNDYDRSMSNLSRILMNTCKNDKEMNYRIEHTKDVVNLVVTIGVMEEISERDIKCLILSAIFHDIGKYIDKSKHDIISSSLWEIYKPDNISIDDAETIKNIICAHSAKDKGNIQNENILQSILKDADVISKLLTIDSSKVSNKYKNKISNMSAEDRLKSIRLHSSYIICALLTAKMYDNMRKK